MKRSQSKGFTLIELLVVIAIIGLLSTLAVVALNSARQRSRDAKRVSDIRQIQTALELAFSESNNYPGEGPTTLGLASDDVLCNNGGAASFQGDTTGCTTIYMGLVPTNPTPNGAAYVYTSASNSGTYSITFTLEGATGQLGAGTNCANQNGIQAGSSC
jgi:prepilin-type N-terminal cleavage/methylation domain-containing protein